MSDLINEYNKSGIISDRQWFLSFVCGDCIHFTGEECNGCRHEGKEVYPDSTACDEFEDKDS